jgi:ferredoxin-fold anticodon binding domain-containing protein
MTTNITNNAGYLIKLLSPNQINTFNDFQLQFNIYGDSFNDNDVLTVTLHSDNYVSGRSYIVTNNLIYNINQINYTLSSNNNIFTNLSTRIDGEYYLVISSSSKTYTSDPNKFIYITTNLNNNVTFQINKDNLSYNVTKNTNLLLNYIAYGFNLGSTFNIKIGDFYQSPQITVTNSNSYELLISIPNNIINKNYNAVLNHDYGHIMDIVSDIKVNTFIPNTNILPCNGFNSVPFNQNPSTIIIRNTTKTIPLPPEVIGLNVNIIYNNTSYSGNINLNNLKNVNKNELVINTDSTNTKFNINNHRIFDNQLLYNTFSNQEIIQVNQSNQISLTYTYRDSYIINLNTIKTNHINNNKVTIDKELDIYSSNNSDELNLNLYGTFPIINDSYGKYLSLNTNIFNLTGELHFYVKNSINQIKYVGSISLIDKIDNSLIDNNVLTTPVDTQYLIKILDPAIINTTNDNFTINFNIYENAFNNNDVLKVLLGCDRFATGREFTVTQYLIYDKKKD